MYGSGGSSGAGVAGALAALGAVVSLVLSIVYHLDRAARPRRRRAPSPPPQRPVERWHEAPRGMEGGQRGPTKRPPMNAQTLAQFRGQPAQPHVWEPRSLPPLPLPLKEPQDAPPTSVHVPQRQFVRAARMVAAAQHASRSMLQRRLVVGEELAERLMLALEGSGVIGARPESGGLPPVLVRLEDLPALFARFGIVEDALPPDAETH